MKNGIFLILLLSILQPVYSDQPINFNDPNNNLMCNKYKINANSSKNDLSTNCIVVKMKSEQESYGRKDKLKVKLNDGEYLKCIFVNDKLKGCNLDD